ncbi:PRC-barrel domain-containing protein [Azospirillum sp. SYSU D00513]|uniref:PRC-barrel domain-containing protein n=1 Tax=Azospirillum sp. SYSU D00513 TaxID=2812561 RepID=UPI001A970BEC|nr:PRC-barrel domain-containing protein [Azospirillum sp. SYSU D00513]
MRSAILAASALALLAAAAAAPTAAAQDTVNQGTAGQSAAPAAGGTTPLMTAPRPEDTATTSPQSSQEGMDGSAPSDEMTAPAQGTASQGTGGAQEEVAAAPPLTLDTAAARELVGRDVQTRDGKSGGMIRDFTLGGPNGGVDRVVLSSGAFIGAEAEMISVPASELRMDAPENASTPPASEKPTTRLSLDMTLEELTKAPSFAYDGKAKTLVNNQ